MLRVPVLSKVFFSSSSFNWKKETSVVRVYVGERKAFFVSNDLRPMIPHPTFVFSLAAIHIHLVRLDFVLASSSVCQEWMR